MNRLNQEEVLAAFRERAQPGPVNWEYAGNRWDYSYRLQFPDLCFLIRGFLAGKVLVYGLIMTDSGGETLGLAVGDSAEPEPSYYSELGDIFLSARRQAGNPSLESARQS